MPEQKKRQRGGMCMKWEWLINFMVRGSLGLVFIYLINIVLLDKGYTCFGAINVASFLVCGIFGIPGFLVIGLVVLMRMLGW